MDEEEEFDDKVLLDDDLDGEEDIEEEDPLSMGFHEVEGLEPEADF